MNPIIPQKLPPLRPGQHLSRAEFERRYDAMPELKKAELIDGVVYMPSPVTRDHFKPHFDAITWLGAYSTFTPGVEGGDNGSLRLDLESMPQPDAFLRIQETHGGQSCVDADGYIAGAPELVVEVAVSNAAFDLDVKLPFYQRNTVREYFVWRVPEKVIDWFTLRGGKFARLRPGTGGLYRSKVFPGLWLDAEALLASDLPTVAAVVRQGLNSPEHAAFVEKLERKAARTRP
jgi:Uma2 family endonuclease